MSVKNPNYYRIWQANRRALNRALGLTWDGKPRRRKLRPDLKNLTRNQRHAVTNRERAHRFMAAGLTWLGTEPKSLSGKRRRFRLSFVIPPQSFEDAWATINMRAYK